VKGKLLLAAKVAVSKTPAFLGTKLSGIPFEYRLGKEYSSCKSKVVLPVSSDEILATMKQLVSDSYHEIPFYKEFYNDNSFHPDRLVTFEDLALIPIVRKSDLKGYDIGSRSVKDARGILTNTGGTSGQPLGLMLDGSAYAREWAHMHAIWEKLGYETSDVKITLRGMNLGSDPVRYNFIHNEFQINAYCEIQLVFERLVLILKKYKVKYLHGYPSSIYEFLRSVENQKPELLGLLKKELKGIFLGSEYPAPIYRDFIESKLGVKTISWYGHSEMAVLAGECSPYIYQPLHNYGYTEAVEMPGGFHLIGTTINNKISPLIRYDTEDLIEPVSFTEHNILESFRISQGRVGEFVVDKNNRKVSLTALIFGRHHEMFEYAEFIQVSQLSDGAMTVWVTTASKDIDWKSKFDDEGIFMDLSFEIIRQPFKTQAGKLPLLINNLI